MNIIDLAKPEIIHISAAGNHMPAKARGKHAAVLYPEFGVMFAVHHGIDGAMTYDEAVKRCAALKHGGAEDWGLASDVRLLQLTVDYSRCNPAADPKLFPDTVSNRWYWTAHGCAWSKDSKGTPRAFWQVCSSHGDVTCADRGTSDGFVRPCRVVGRPGQ